MTTWRIVHFERVFNYTNLPPASFLRKQESRIKMTKKQPAVHILASKRNGTLYTGVTADLLGRVWEHKNDAIEGFTKKYSVHRLVYFEQHETMPSAIEREKQIKKWKRKWKQELIEEQNPTWKDLYEEAV